MSDGEEFELYCVSLLELNGYKNVSLTPVIGDHGVDIIAEKDNIKYDIQCKYYSVPVGNNAVQEVFTGRAFYKCDIAIVMTNSTYTRQAIEEATALGVKLWDGDYLQDLKQLHASKL
ncbi:restriction endonuclease [Butyrivibrio sp. X503]|nr:restriction endonuclease [Butyrivibrio sp. X503]